MGKKDIPNYHSGPFTRATSPKHSNNFMFITLQGLPPDLNKHRTGSFITFITRKVLVFSQAFRLISVKPYCQDSTNKFYFYTNVYMLSPQKYYFCAIHLLKIWYPEDTFQTSHTQTLTLPIWTISLWRRLQQHISLAHVDCVILPLGTSLQGRGFNLSEYILIILWKCLIWCY